MAFKNYSTKFTNTSLSGMTQSTVTTEYYYPVDAKHKPLVVLDGTTAMSEGTLGSLAVGEWAWGDNDTLGYDTIYVRKSDDTAPADGDILASLAVTLTTVAVGKALGVFSQEARNADSSDHNIKLIRTDSSDVVIFDNEMSVAGADFNVLDHGVTLTEGQKLKVMADSEDISVCVSGNEV